jgi:hypothetical protein
MLLPVPMILPIPLNCGAAADFSRNGSFENIFFAILMITKLDCRVLLNLSESAEQGVCGCGAGS